MNVEIPSTGEKQLFTKNISDQWKSLKLGLICVVEISFKKFLCGKKMYQEIMFDDYFFKRILNSTLDREFEAKFEAFSNQ